MTIFLTRIAKVAPKVLVLASFLLIATPALIAHADAPLGNGTHSFNLIQA